MAAKNHPEKLKASGNLYIPNFTHFRKKIRSTKLPSLPEWFVIEHGESLRKHSTVLLEVPTGDVWQVRLEISDDDGLVGFKGGEWGEFTSFYKLKKGYELDFRYEIGSNKFKVEIYKPATEIRYPIRQPNSVSTPTVEELKDDASPVNKLSSLSGFQSSKRLKVSNNEDLPSKIGEAEASVRTESFEVVMKQSSVRYPYTWWLPAKFVLEFIKDDEESGKIKLIGGKSKAWVVRLTRNKEGRVRGSTTDWRKFVEDNSLVVGDVCVLELMMMSGANNGDPLSFKLTIRRAGNVQNLDDDDALMSIMSDDSSSPSPPPLKRMRKSNGKAGVSQPADSAKYPFFQVGMVERNYLYHKNIWAFVKDNLNSQLKEQFLTFKTKVADRSWPVKLRNYPDNFSAKLGAGLREFLTDNFVEVGDLCTFELINRKEKLFMVSISKDKMSKKVDKENKEGSIELDLDEEKQEETSSEGNQGVVSDKQQQQLAGSKFVSKYPSFQATIEESSFTTEILFVDWEFAKDHINTELEKQAPILQGGGGRLWPVMLICRSKQTLTFMGELREFLKESNVKVGDVCTFELVDKKNLVFRVSVISRSDEAAN